MTAIETKTDISARALSSADKDFLEEARDLLGFIRIENAILMEDGDLSLSGLYMQKMMRLKDLEEKVEHWAIRPKTNARHLDTGLHLLSAIQKELQHNAGQHLAALSKIHARKTASAALRGDTALDNERGAKCH